MCKPAPPPVAFAKARPVCSLNNYIRLGGYVQGTLRLDVSSRVPARGSKTPAPLVSMARGKLPGFRNHGNRSPDALSIQASDASEGAVDIIRNGGPHLRGPAHSPAAAW